MLCLSITRNKEGLGHDKRPDTQPLERMDLILNMYGSVRNCVLSNKKDGLEAGKTGREDP